MHCIRQLYPVQSETENANNPTAKGRKKSAFCLSKDGKWRSFPRVPHLLQYVSSGTYFARVKIKGKISRESLETTVWSDALLKLVDFLKEKHTVKDKKDAVKVSFSEATELYKKRVENDHAMKKRSKGYRLLCIRKIESSWPGVTKRCLGEITEAECRAWVIELQPKLAGQYFNNVLGTFRLIIDEGIKELKQRGGEPFENPAAELSRAKIAPKVLQLPERDQFKKMVSAIRNGSSWGAKAGDLVEFLAYNWLSSRGNAPLSFTNIDNLDDWDRNALQVDNPDPAWLAYKVVENDGHTNLSCDRGTISFWFVPNWESTNIDGGTGPGDWAQLIDVGMWTSNATYGWWSLYLNPAGTGIYFSAQTNGAGIDYLGYPISWDWNTWHLITLTYSSTNTSLYLDGQVATNGAGLVYLPPDAVLTNGFFIGSDNTGLAQAHGLFEDLRTYSYQLNATVVSNYYAGILPDLPSAGGFSMDGSTPPFPGGGDGSGSRDSGLDTPSGGGLVDYGTNLCLQLPGVYTNAAQLILWNTQPDIQYEILSKENLLDSEWQSEGFLYGSEGTNWTSFLTFEGNRTNTLFFWARSWAFSTGSGIPDWWWLQYFGQKTNVDAYANPTGDGYNNLQKFQSGLNPTNYYNPNPPAPFFGCLDSTGTNYVLEWNAAPGPVVNYVIQRAYYNSTNNGYDFFPIATVSSNTTFFKDIGAVYRGYFYWIYYNDSEDFYTLTAVYPGGDSSGTQTWWISDGSETPTSVYARLDSTGTNIFLSWGAASGPVTNYIVERGIYTNSTWVYTPIASVNTNTFSYEILRAITNQFGWAYTYGVEAAYSGGGYSDVATSPINIAPANGPDGPAGFTGYGESNGTNIFLFWNPVSGTVTNYVIYGELYNSQVQAWLFVKLGQVKAATNFFEAKGSVVSGGSLYYYYYVQAVYADGSLSKAPYWHYASQLPPAPGAFSAHINLTGTNIVLSWTPPPIPVSGYTIQQSVDGGNYFYEFDAVGSNITSYVETNGVADADEELGLDNLWYQIKATYPDGGVSAGVAAQVSTNLPAPTGLSAVVDFTGTNVIISWSPPPGTINSYTISRGAFDPSSGVYVYTPIGTVSGATTFTYSGIFKSDDTYAVFANISGEQTPTVFSYVSTPAHSSSPTSSLNITAQMVRNESGRWQLMFSQIPTNVVEIAFYWYMYDYYYDLGPYATIQPYSTEFDIPANSISNNIYVIPYYWMTNWFPNSHQGKVAVVQPVDINGKYGKISQAGFQPYDSPAYVDARVHLKQNLLYKLRAANVNIRNSELSEDNLWWNPTIISYTVPEGDTNYAESSFFHFAEMTKGYDSFGAYYIKMDNVWPIIANYQYHKQVYDPNYTNQEEFLWQHDLGGYGTFPSFQGTLDTVPAPPILAISDPYWVQQNTANLSNLAAYTNGNSFFLQGGAHNLFGLSFGTAMVNPRGWRYDDESDTWVFDPPITVDPGGSPVAITNSDSSLNVNCFFSQTVDPVIQLTNYYFAPVVTPRTGLLGETTPTQPYPLPVLYDFASTNQTGVIITSVGNPAVIGGWAKFSILNGSPTKFAYLGQYFVTNAFVVTNGVVSANKTGVVSPYGDFFPTEPGMVAMVTMPDIDMGMQATGIVRVVSLNVDANHDGIMDFKYNGSDFVSTNKPFRFWVNDNNDHGDDGGDGVPDQGQDSDGIKFSGRSSYGPPVYKVQGRRDLVDFFPVYINIGSLFQDAPGSPGIDPLDSQYHVRLKHTYGALRFTETSLTPTNYMDYLRNTNTAGSLQSVSLSTITPEGVDLSAGFLNTLKISNGGIILVESWFPTTAPLTLEIWHNTNLIGTASLSLSISGVEQMFRHKNVLLGPTPIGTGLADRLDDSDVTNEPDTNGKNFIFLHGYNVSPYKARGWFSDMYKRLYWSGSHARFYGVTYTGNDGQILGTVTPNLQINIVHALATAPSLCAFLNGLSGPNILAAHSLGNMVVLGTMNYTNTSINTFFMIDAAVPIEAIQGNAEESANMEHPDWVSYAEKLQASEWYKLFLTNANDYRKTLTWRDRLTNFGTAAVYNFYSSGEEVLRQHAGEPPVITAAVFDQAVLDTFFGVEPQGTFTWAWQEKLKGRCPGDWIIGSSHGGWKFNYNPPYLFVTNGLPAFISPPASQIPNSQLQTNALFDLTSSNFGTSDLALYGANGSIYAQTNRDRILSAAIPALTLPVGANPVSRLAPEFGPDRNKDMQNVFENGWPSDRGTPQWPVGTTAFGEWHHSDVQQVAYTFTYKLFDEIVNDGNLK